MVKMSEQSGDILDDPSVKIKRTVREAPEKCNVCDYPYGAHTRARVQCKQCKYTSCKACYKQYFLTKANPQCMECNTVWTQDVLESCFPRTWCNSEYRKHMENVMFQQELSLMPLASAEINRRKLEQDRQEMTENLGELEQQIEQLRQTVVRYNRRAASGTDWAILERDQHVPRIELKIKTLEQEYDTMVAEIIKFNESNLFDNTNIVSSRPCFTPECRGYLNFKHECVVCNTTWCSACHTRLGQNHVCDQNLVKTYRMLEKDTKNCPGCKTLIYKISGCDQMYCISCNTAFSWETGQIEKGRIHNPHYFEYLQRRERDQQPAGDTGCVELSLHLIMKANTLKNVSGTPIGDFIIELERFRTHIDETNLRHWAEILREDPTRRNLDIRIEYLLKHIDEKTFKSQMVKRDIGIKLNTHYYNLVYSLSMVCRDILVRYLQDPGYQPDIVRKEIIEYAKYFNIEMEKISVWFDQSYKKHLIVNTGNIILDSIKRVKNEMMLTDEELNSITSKTEWLDSDERKYMEHYEWFSGEVAKFCGCTSGYRRQQTQINYQESANVLINIFETNTEFAEAIWDYEQVVSTRNKQRIRTNILKHIMNKFGRGFRLIWNGITDVYRYVSYSTSFNNEEIVSVPGYNSEIEYRMLLFFIPLYTVYMPNQVISENTVQSTVCYLDQCSIRYCKMGRQRNVLNLCNIVGALCERLLVHPHASCQDLHRTEQLWNGFYERVYTLKPDAPGSRYTLTEQYKQSVSEKLQQMYTALVSQPGYTRKQVVKNQHARMTSILGLQSEL